MLSSMIFMIRIGIECMKCADIEEESDRRAKVVTAVSGTYLNAAL